MMHSSTMPGRCRRGHGFTRRPARRARGRESLRAPRNLPVGVRTALTMTASRMTIYRAPRPLRGEGSSESAWTLIRRTTPDPSISVMRASMSGLARAISFRQASERARISSVPFESKTGVAARESAGPAAILQAKASFASLIGWPSKIVRSAPTAAESRGRIRKRSYRFEGSRVPGFPSRTLEPWNPRTLEPSNCRTMPYRALAPRFRLATPRGASRLRRALKSTSSRSTSTSASTVESRRCSIPIAWHG